MSSSQQVEFMNSFTASQETSLKTLKEILQSRLFWPGGQYLLHDTY